MSGWAIYKRDDLYKPGLLYPTEELRRDAQVTQRKWRRPKTVSEAAQLVMVTNHTVTEWVKIARVRGASWAEVAAVLGITRQAAWSRFRRQCTVTTKVPDERILKGVLEVLQHHGGRAEQAHGWAAELVREARSEGTSWENIGRQLGVRRQTAWERYRHVDHHPAR